MRLLRELLAEVGEIDAVADVRGRGFMAGIDLGDRDPSLQLARRVANEARRRGAIIRPLGDVLVLMPPLAISKADLRRLVHITAASIDAVIAAEEDSEAVTEEMAAIQVPLRQAA
jgi:adenosylmethionine---8-amino-7-oxononanoate aminotransferase